MNIEKIRESADKILDLSDKAITHYNGCKNSNALLNDMKNVRGETVNLIDNIRQIKPEQIKPENVGFVVGRKVKFKFYGYECTGKITKREITKEGKTIYYIDSNGSCPYVVSDINIIGYVDIEQEFKYNLGDMINYNHCGIQKTGIIIDRKLLIKFGDGISSVGYHINFSGDPSQGYDQVKFSDIVSIFVPKYKIGDIVLTCFPSGKQVKCTIIKICGINGYYVEALSENYEQIHMTKLESDITSLDHKYKVGDIVKVKDRSGYERVGEIVKRDVTGKEPYNFYEIKMKDHCYVFWEKEVIGLTNDPISPNCHEPKFKIGETVSVKVHYPNEEWKIGSITKIEYYIFDGFFRYEVEGTLEKLGKFIESNVFKTKCNIGDFVVCLNNKYKVKCKIDYISPNKDGKNIYYMQYVRDGKSEAMIRSEDGIFPYIENEYNVGDVIEYKIYDISVPEKGIIHRKIYDNYNYNYKYSVKNMDGSSFSFCFDSEDILNEKVKLVTKANRSSIINKIGTLVKFKSATGEINTGKISQVGLTYTILEENPSHIIKQHFNVQYTDIIDVIEMAPVHRYKIGDHVKFNTINGNLFEGVIFRIPSPDDGPSYGIKCSIDESKMYTLEDLIIKVLPEPKYKIGETVRYTEEYSNYWDKGYVRRYEYSDVGDKYVYYLNDCLGPINGTFSDNFIKKYIDNKEYKVNDVVIYDKNLQGTIHSICPIYTIKTETGYHTVPKIKINEVVREYKTPSFKDVSKFKVDDNVIFSIKNKNGGITVIAGTITKINDVKTEDEVKYVIFVNPREKIYSLSTLEANTYDLQKDSSYQSFKYNVGDRVYVDGKEYDYVVSDIIYSLDPICRYVLKAISCAGWPISVPSMYYEIEQDRLSKNPCPIKFKSGDKCHIKGFVGEFIVNNFDEYEGGKNWYNLSSTTGVSATIKVSEDNLTLLIPPKPKFNVGDICWFNEVGNSVCEIVSKYTDGNVRVKMNGLVDWNGKEIYKDVDETKLILIKGT